MTLLNQAIFEANDGYSKKVKDLEGCLAEDDFELEKITTDLEKISTDLDFNRRVHYNTTEEDLGLEAQCNEVFEEKESLIAEKMRIGALTKQVEDFGGSYVSLYKSSDDYEESQAS